jgi:hypothetical protein
MEFSLDRQVLERRLILSIVGAVDFPSLSGAIEKAEGELLKNPDFNLVINGDEITRFNIPNHTCQQVAPRLFGQSRPASFYSSAPLAFGMARVMQTYSFNDSFAVFKTYEEAINFVSSGKVTSSSRS